MVAGGLALLALEPRLGLAVLAGTGAALLLAPRPRAAMATLVALLGAAGTVLAGQRTDVPLGVAGVVVAFAAAAAAARSSRWPGPRRAGASPRPGADREPTSRDTWDALDRGEDPTVR